jgi:serine protease AprX
MSKISFLISLAFILLSGLVVAQIAPNTYYIQFSDKHDSPYSIYEPEEFLTQRAIERRQAQGISITEQDLPVNPFYLEAVAELGPTMLFPTKWLNGVTIYTTDPGILAAINELPFVVNIRSLAEGEVPAQPKPKDFFANESITDGTIPAAKSTAGLPSINYGSGFNQIDQINGIPLHNAGYLGQGMVIALLDGGYTNTNVHPAFDSLLINGQILGTKDFVEPGGDVFTQSSHGTAVLSTIASNVPGQLVGTAPKAHFWLLRPEYVPTENLVEEYNWVSAAEFADSVGANIINSSLGYINFDMPQHNHPYSHMDGNTCIVTIGADIAASKGILVVNSAGNSGNNNQFPYIGAPADGFDVFSIGAVDANGLRASFSSIGPTFDLRIKPDVMARGLGAAVASGSSGFGSANGTSFSSPIIAGMSACLWQANPDFTNMEIKQAIMLSGNFAHNPDIYMGHGIPNYEMANANLTSLRNQKENKNNLIRLYPNPFAHQITVIAMDTAIHKIQVYDIDGRMLFNIEHKLQPEKELEKLLPGLRSGVYVVHVFGNFNQQVLKVVKGF